jgi:hypothetical protein
MAKKLKQLLPTFLIGITCAIISGFIFQSETFGLRFIIGLSAALIGILIYEIVIKILKR